MASLKDINEEIIKGNEDLERLNKNFEAWIKSQQPTGDDLEAKREAKKALSSVGFKQVFRKDAQKKTGGSGGLFGTGLSAKGLLGLTALIGPLLITIFRKEIGDLLKNLIPKIPGFTTDDGQVEFPDNPSSMPFSGKTLQIAIRSLQGNLKNQILKYNKLLSETRSLRLQVRTLTSSSLGKVGGKPTVPNRPPPLSISGRPGTNKPGEGFTRSGVNNRKYLPNIPPGKNPRDFDAKTAKQYGNRFGAKTLGGGFQYITEEQFKKLKPNASGFSDQNPQKAPKPGIRSSMLTSVNRVLQKVLPAFDEKETFRALVQANLFPDQKRFPNAFAYGSAIFDYIKQYTPGPIKTIARVLFHPAVMRIIFSAAVFGEIGLILANKKIVLKGVFTGEKMLVNANYTIAEQIVGVGALISGFAGGALGSSIGGMIGAIAGPLGIFTGAVIGGYLGFKSGYFIAKFLFDLAFKKKNGIAFYKKELEVFQKAKKGVQLNQGMMAMNSGGMKDSTLGQLVPGDTMMGTSNISSLSEAKAARAGNAGNFGSAMSNREQVLGRVGLSIGSGPKAPGLIKKGFASILSGVSTLGSMMFGPAGASEMSLPSVSNGLLALGENTPTMGPGTNGAPPVIVDASSKSFSDHKSVHMMPPITPHTVDTSLTFFNSVGPMSNLERARMR